MRVLFLIPARGGSKGIPDKNLQCVGGIPLVGRSARVAAEARKRLGGGGRVICSTDSTRIAEAARTWGAEVPFLRPAELATDSASSMDVVFHAINALHEDYDAVVLIQPTSPLVEVDDVLGAIEMHRTAGSPVVSVCPSEHPVEWSFTLDAAGRLLPLFAGEQPHQRQGCRPTYRQNGAVYVASVETLRAQGDFVGEDTRGFVMPPERSIDVDSLVDLQVAESVLCSRATPLIEMGGRPIGPGQPCFIIAEAGVNHNGDLELARRLVDAAADAGADAVKFQTWITEKICAPGAKKADYQDRSCPAAADQFAMLKRIELPYAWHPELKARAEARGLVFLSTPDEIQSARFLCSIGVPAIKVGSAEATNLPHLEQLARLGKPLIVSTGMATLEEVARAVAAIRGATSQPFALLHCVSACPAPEEEMNLSAIAALRRAFGVPVGLSDHTTRTTAAVIGAALGMNILEKHLTLDRNMPGPDHAASSDPAQFADLVRMVRKAEAMLGSGEKRLMPSEANTRQVVSRTLLYAAPLAAGQRVEETDFEALRCGQPGLPPDAVAGLVGRVLRRPVGRGDVVAEADFQ